MSHPDLFHLSFCLYPPPSHLPNYPLCIYTCVLCLVCLLSVRLFLPGLNSVLPVSRVLFSSFSRFWPFCLPWPRACLLTCTCLTLTWLWTSACPDSEPACCPVPAWLWPDHKPLPVLDLPFAWPVFIINYLRTVLSASCVCIWVISWVVKLQLLFYFYLTFI
jgi:hypothetical protein